MSISSFNKTGEDYSSISAWESDTDNDLITAAEGETLEIHADDGEVVPTGSITLYGATTNTTYYREIRAATGDTPTGAWDASKTTLKGTNGGSAYFISLSEAFSELKQLQIYGYSSSGYIVQASYYEGTNVNNCILDCEDNCYGVRVHDVDSLCYRNIIYNGTVYGSILIAAACNNVNNNTCINSARGIRNSGGATVIIKNNICLGNSTADYEFTFSSSSSNNISSDTTAPGSNSLQSRAATASSSPGAGDWVIFNNITAGSEDYRLQDNSTDNDAIDAGANLGSPYDLEIAGNTVTGTWDVGAFEVQVSGTTVSLTESDLTVSGYAVDLVITIQVSESDLAISSYIPTISIGATETVVLAESDLTVSGYAVSPLIEIKQTVLTSESDLAIFGYILTASVGVEQTIVLQESDLTVSGYAIDVDLLKEKEVQFTESDLLITEYVPTISGEKVAALATSDLLITGYLPIIPTVFPKITVKEFGGDYSTLAIALDNANDGDLISIEGTWVDPDISPAVVNNDNITIQTDADSRHSWRDVATPTFYRRETSSGHGITVNNTGCIIDGILARQSSTGDSDEVIRMAVTGVLTVKNSVLLTQGSVNNQDGIHIPDVAATVNLETCIIHGFYRAGILCQGNNNDVTLNINSCLFYDNGIDVNDGGGVVMQSYAGTKSINVFNTVSVGNNNSAKAKDYNEHRSTGGTVTWNIHNSIDSDGSITDRDSGASACLQNRTPTDNTSPAAGDWVLFEDITSLPHDLRLLVNAENDAWEMHSATTGAGLLIPTVGLIDQVRIAPYDCGAYEVSDEGIRLIYPNLEELVVRGYAAAVSTTEVLTVEMLDTVLSIAGYAPILPVVVKSSDLAIEGGIFGLGKYVDLTQKYSTLKTFGYSVKTNPSPLDIALIASEIRVLSTSVTILVSDTINECKRLWKRLADSFDRTLFFETIQLIRSDMKLVGEVIETNLSVKAASVRDETLSITGYAPKLVFGIDSVYFANPATADLSIVSYESTAHGIISGGDLIFDPTTGLIEIDFTLALAYTGYAETEILSAGSGNPDVLYLSAVGEICTNEGSNEIAIPVNWSSGTNVKAIIDYGSGTYELSLLINNSDYYSQVAVFDGTYGGSGILAAAPPANVSINVLEFN